MNTRNAKENSLNTKLRAGVFHTSHLKNFMVFLLNFGLVFGWLDLGINDLWSPISHDFFCARQWWFGTSPRWMWHAFGPNMPLVWGTSAERMTYGEKAGCVRCLLVKLHWTQSPTDEVVSKFMKWSILGIWGVTASQRHLQSHEAET